MPARSTRRRRIFGRFLLLVLPLVLAFAVAETALRLAGDQAPGRTSLGTDDSRWLQLDKSDQLGWIFPPDTTGYYRSGGHPTLVTTNPWGLRGPAVAADSLTRKVLVLGDSYAFGWGVPDEKGFVRRLEAALRQEFPAVPIECINGGVPGYAIYQQTLMLDYVRRRTPIDAVVATISLANDPVDDLRIRRFAPDHLAEFRYDLRDPSSATARIIAASRLLTLLDLRTTSLQFSLTNTNRECQTLACESMTQLAKVCREAGLPLVWLIVPRAQEIRSGPVWRGVLNGATDRMRTHFRELAADLKVPCLDLKPVLAKTQAKQDAYLAADAHWNEAGHRAVAAAVLPVLLKSWPLQQPDDQIRSPAEPINHQR